LLTQELTASPGADLPGQSITYENLIASTSDFDVSAISTTGSILFKKAGWYRISKTVNGSLTPIDIPLRVWSVGLFVNGIPLPGSCFAQMTISPDQQANHTSATVIYKFAAGDSLTVNNCSDLLLHLNAFGLGTNVASVSSTINIQRLDA